MDRYLVIQWRTLFAECDSLTEVVAQLPLKIDRHGQVTFDGKKVNPNYILVTRDDRLDPFDAKKVGWEPFDALKDWVKYHLNKNTLGKWEIYKAERM